MRTELLIMGSLLPVISTVTYTVSILKGKTRPERMTRFLMLVITGVMTLALWVQHDTSGIWLALVSCLQALLLLGLSFHRGIGGRSRLDMLCLVLCLAGVVWWLIAKEPLMGLIASITADLIACLPSLHKTIRLPHTEIVSFYLLDAIAGLLVLMAGPFTWQAGMFPAYIILINAGFVAAIVWPRRTA